MVSHKLDPKNLMVTLIWPKELKIEVSYFKWLVSPLMKAMMRPTNDGGVFIMLFYRY